MFTLEVREEVTRWVRVQVFASSESDATTMVQEGDYDEGLVELLNEDVWHIDVMAHEKAST